VPSIPDPAIGTVVDVNLRVTTVRTIDGEVVITPNGQITQVTTCPATGPGRGGRARAVTADVTRVSDLLERSRAGLQDVELHHLLFDAPQVIMQSLDVDHFQLRVVARTLPGKQFESGGCCAPGSRPASPGASTAADAGNGEPDGISNPSMPLVLPVPPTPSALPARLD